jgi:hypothetical protein
MERRAKLTVPVFLGDGMQWNLRRYVGGADVLVEVPGEQPLHIPAGFAEDQAASRGRWTRSTRGLADGWARDAVGRALRRIEGVVPADADALAGHLRTVAGAVPRRPERHLDLRVPQPGAAGLAVAGRSSGRTCWSATRPG